MIILATAPERCLADSVKGRTSVRASTKIINIIFWGADLIDSLPAQTYFGSPEPGVLATWRARHESRALRTTRVSGEDAAWPTPT